MKRMMNMRNPEWKDEKFCEWLAERGYSELVGTSHPYLQELRVQYEEEMQDSESGNVSPSDTLHGGPFDGLWLDDEHWGSAYLYVSLGGGRVAVYKTLTQGGEVLQFTGYRKTGEGCMPHIYPDKVSL